MPVIAGLSTRRTRSHSRGWIRNRADGLHALVKLLLFDLAVLIGVWIVHQTEYLIEYGSRFNAVMAGTPHHLYMQPAALILALLAAAATGICIVTCLGHVRLTREAAQRLSPRMARRLHTLASPIPVARTGWTAAALFTAQAAVYTVQENLESWQITGMLPGTNVLFGAPHLTVLPLHALVASSLAIILTAGTARVRQAQRTSRVARTLAALFEAAKATEPQAAPAHVYFPSLTPTAGCRGLLSPPLSA